MIHKQSQTYPHEQQQNECAAAEQRIIQSRLFYVTKEVNPRLEKLIWLALYAKEIVDLTAAHSQGGWQRKARYHWRRNETHQHAEIQKAQHQNNAAR